MLTVGILPTFAQKEGEGGATPTPAATATEGETPAATPEPEPSPSPTPTPKPSKPSLIYICDTGNSRVIRVGDMQGKGFAYFGYPGSGAGRLLNPSQVWVDPLDRLYIADTGNNRILRMEDFAGKGYVEMTGFNAPEGVASKGDELYVADTGNNQILVYSDMNGTLKRTIKDKRLDHPISLWLDETGTLYVCCGSDPPGGRIVKLVEAPDDPEGKKWEIYSGQGLRGTGFAPSAAMTWKGQLLFVDSASHRVGRVDNFSGRAVRENGNFGRTANRYKNPMGGGIDKEGKIYVADTGNDRIIRIDNVTGANWVEYQGPQDRKSLTMREPRSVFVWSPAPTPSPSPSPTKEKGKDK